MFFADAALAEIDPEESVIGELGDRAW